MLTREQAKAIALKEILKNWNIEDDEPVIVDEDSSEEDFGWVFVYESRNFLDTKIYTYLLCGNGPVIVNKHDGSVHLRSAGRDVEDHIEEYRQELLKKQE
jgi:hypothetical protein